VATAGRSRANAVLAASEEADTVTFEGGKPLIGEVEVRGAKNLVTKAMVAALLGDSPSVLRGVPAIRDVAVVKGLLEAHSVTVTELSDGELELDPRGAKSAHFAEIDAHAGSSRIPILFCGPLLHQLGEAFIPDLGGCRIGDRPINFHLDALRAFGAEIDKSYEGIRLKAPRRLVGARIDLLPQLGATEQVLLTAVRAQGVTELTNAAIEPEIVDLIAIFKKWAPSFWSNPIAPSLSKGWIPYRAIVTKRSLTEAKLRVGPLPPSPRGATFMSAVLCNKI